MSTSSTRAWVVDASALFEILTAASRAALAEQVLGPARLLAPALLDAEILGALRRQVRRGTIGPERAEAAVGDLTDLNLERVALPPLLGRAWELRDNLTAGDALYVALAESVGCPLLTSDAPLSRAARGLVDVVLLP